MHRSNPPQPRWAWERVRDVRAPWRSCPHDADPCSSYSSSLSFQASRIVPVYTIAVVDIGVARSGIGVEVRDPQGREPPGFLGELDRDLSPARDDALFILAVLVDVRLMDDADGDGGQLGRVRAVEPLAAGTTRSSGSNQTSPW